MDDNGEKLVPLCFAVGSLVTQKHIDSIYAEARLWPDGSRDKIAFVAYARRLQRKLEQQKKME